MTFNEDLFINAINALDEVYNPVEGSVLYQQIKYSPKESVVKLISDIPALKHLKYCEGTAVMDFLKSGENQGISAFSNIRPYLTYSLENWTSVDPDNVGYSAYKSFFSFTDTKLWYSSDYVAAEHNSVRFAEMYNLKVFKFDLNKNILWDSQGNRIANLTNVPNTFIFRTYENFTELIKNHCYDSFVVTKDVLSTEFLDFISKYSKAKALSSLAYNLFHYDFKEYTDIGQEKLVASLFSKLKEWTAAGYREDAWLLSAFTCFLLKNCAEDVNKFVKLNNIAMNAMFDKEDLQTKQYPPMNCNILVPKNYKFPEVKIKFWKKNKLRTVPMMSRDETAYTRKFLGLVEFSSRELSTEFCIQCRREDTTWSSDMEISYIKGLEKEFGITNCSCCSTQLKTTNTVLDDESKAVCFSCAKISNRNLVKLNAYSDSATKYFDFKGRTKLSSLPKVFATRVLHNRGRYYGIECELEVKNGITVEQARQAIAMRAAKHCIMKLDGSVPKGFELCSAPATYESHISEFKPILEVSEKYMEGTSHTGIHIHVSRTGLSNTHIYKMQLFMNNPKNNNFITFVANRSANRYSKYNHSLTRHKDLLMAQALERYHALNTSNEETIEFRIFNSTTNFDLFASYLDFTKGVIEWTESVPIINGLKYEDYIEFIKTYRKDFPYLYSRLKSTSYMEVPK